MYDYRAFFHYLLEGALRALGEGKCKLIRHFMLAALRKAPDENGLVTLTDIMGYVKRAKNKTPPELGRFDKLGEKNTGGFVLRQGGCSVNAPSLIVER